MSAAAISIPNVLSQSPVRVVFGPGTLSQLGAIAREFGATRVLLVSDPHIVAAGYVDRAESVLKDAGIEPLVFDGARENPTTEHVAAGVAAVRDAGVDLIVGLGGGSAMDCAKGINLILTNGGDIADYWGEDKPAKPMLPSIAIPTTAGTGSEAQSFALISDPVTHQKMACGDRRPPAKGGLRPQAAILDSDLTRTQPRHVATAAGIDAVSHAIETSASTRRDATSLEFSRQAWLRLESSFDDAMRDPENETARQNMLLGAHLAGAAIECSMLGAAHACANPLTARCGILHGWAVGVMLPHVIRFNASNGQNPYLHLASDAELLALRVERMLAIAELALRLRDLNVAQEQLAELAELAAKQWTAGFNPRPVTVDDLLHIYENAF